MLKAIGHPVKDLHRRQFGPLHLGGLKAGAWRDLTRVEVTNLLTLAYRDSVLIKELGDDSEE
jgi:16S rRNA U516 pseudouridylate synthase RsuA-like enzyme